MKKNTQANRPNRDKKIKATRKIKEAKRSIETTQNNFCKNTKCNIIPHLSYFDS